MKKSLVLLVFLFSVAVASAGPCALNVSLLNQDPYPIVPGEYVKLVFQVEGIEAPECKDINFKLVEDYPIRFNPGETGERNFKKVDYVRDYKSNILIPFKIQVDEAAIDGANPIEVSVQSGKEPVQLKTFDIEVEDIRANFELGIREYDYTTRELEIEVLNIADTNIEALTMEIPKQEGITIKGPHRIIVGDLDSNEYSSATFEAIPSDGKITVILSYSDEVGERRSVEASVWYDSTYFTDRVADQKETSFTLYYILGAIVLFLLYRWYKKRQKKKKNGKK